jgi:carbonic anhydrase
MMPSIKTVIITCLDPRVGPEDVLGLKLGEAAIIRNVGGRVNKQVIQELSFINRIATKVGGQLGVGWNIIILHHTDCGITRLVEPPEQLAHYLNVDAAHLDSKEVLDPYASIALDVAAIKDSTELPGGYLITGLVYDIHTGKAKIVVDPHAVTVTS